MDRLKTASGSSPQISNLESQISNRPAITACLLTILVWGIHFAWFMRDTRPPVWDMATHQTYAMNYLSSNSPGMDRTDKPWEKSGNYPPFVHLVIAAVFWIFHPGPHIAALANIPATLLLFWAIYELGRDLAGPLAGRWACILAALTPYLIWISRETILDYWLSALFAAALVVLRRTRGFQSGSWSLILGALMGIGLLTKWFFVLLIVPPLLYVFVQFRIWEYPARCIHLFDVILIAGLVAAPWYLPNIPRLVQYFGQNAEFGAREGEPPVLSLQSFIYYIRLLEGYQLFGLLFIFLLLALFFGWRNRLFKDGKFLAVSIAGGWILLTLLRTKDPRFTLPLLGPILIIPGAWIQSWKNTRVHGIAKGTLIILLCIQAYAANFGISSLPRHATILAGYQGSMRWDWNLYLQDYFGIFGQPRREDWKQNEILMKIADDSARKSVRPALAIIPDLPWFSEGNFSLYARFRGMPIRMHHLQSASEGMGAFTGFNYALMTERDQGMPWTTVNSEALNKIVVDNPAIFRLVELYRLPNGDAARLYFIDREPRRDTGNGKPGLIAS